MADESQDVLSDVRHDDCQRTLTAKGMEEKLHHLTTARGGKLGKMTAKSNEREKLLQSENVPDLKDYNKLHEEFIAYNQAMLLYLIN